MVGTGGSIAIGTGGSGPTTGGATSTSRFPCSGQFHPETGLVQCAEGYSHRPVVVECQQPPAVGGAPSFDVGGAGGEWSGDPQDLPRANNTVPCLTHDDCLHYRWGYCDADRVQAAPKCHSGCTADADCGPGAICQCGVDISPSGGVCRSTDCRIDTDCGPGLLCATYVEACGTVGFACQRASDQCASARDCGDIGSCYLERGPSSVGRLCQSVDCGRPFLVENAMRVAATVRDDAWSASLDAEPNVEVLSVFERATQAARWTRMGQLEHASIAAFARFSLQLLSLGAPSELVEACTSALADETQHAKLCFRLASAYAGHAVGPGSLDVSNSLNSTSLGDIVDLVIAEGCFGETIATLTPQEAAEDATDPVIAAAFSRIARDEQRHAELAFGFLRWALEREPALVRSRIVDATESTSITIAARARSSCRACSRCCAKLALLERRSQWRSTATWTHTVAAIARAHGWLRLCQGRARDRAPRVGGRSRVHAAHCAVTATPGTSIAFSANDDTRVGDESQLVGA